MDEEKGTTVIFTLNSSPSIESPSFIKSKSRLRIETVKSGRVCRTDGSLF